MREEAVCQGSRGSQMRRSTTETGPRATTTGPVVLGNQRPKVMLVGGPDVNARIELMRELDPSFSLIAAGSSPELDEEFRGAGYEYAYYPLTRRMNPVKDLRSMALLVRIFRHHRPQIVHAFDTKPCVVARMAARLAGVPIVLGTLPGLGSLYVNNGIATRATRAIYEGVQRLACRLSDLTIFQNDEDACQFTASGIVSPARSRVIPGSGVSTERFDPAKVSKSERERVRQGLGIRSDALLVTMVSRLIRSKGVIEFAAAAGTVRERYPDATFLLLGARDGQSMDRLDDDEVIGLRKSVTWAGTRGDIESVLAASDIFVLPSFLREGIPRALLEAASMGLPIVTTDSPGCNDVVKEGVNGFLVSPRNSEALERAICRLIESPELRRRFGVASRQRALATFDLSRIATETRALYLSLLHRKGLLPAASA